MSFDTSTLNLPGLEQQYGLPSGLLTSVMHAESGGNPTAVSPAGAQGLFQFMPDTAKAYGINPYDPQQAAIGAARMYSDLNKQYNGDVPSMLAAYNWGSGNLQKNGLANAPAETQAYIQKVQAGMSPQQIAGSAGQPTAVGGAGGDTLTPDQATQQLAAMGLGPDGNPLPQTPTAQPATTDITPDAAKQQLAAMGLDENGQPLTLSGKMNASIQKRVDESQKIQDAYKTGKQSLASTALQLLGKSGAGTINDVVGDIGGAISGAIPQQVKDAAMATNPLASVTSAAMNTTTAQDAMKQAGQVYGDVQKQYPVSTADAESVANLVGAVPVVGGALEAVPALAKSAAAVGKAWLDALPDAAKKFGPEDIHSALNDAYTEEKSQSGQLYDLAKQQASGQPIPDASKFATGINGVIADINADPLHPKKSLVPALQDFAAKATNGTMDMGDVLDLRQMMNEQFGSRRFKAPGSNPYTAVGNLARDAVTAQGKIDPVFGGIIKTADEHFKNNILPWRSKVAQSLYKPAEDAANYKAVANGTVNVLNPDTQARAVNVIKNANNAPALRFAQSVLPKAESSFLSKQVLGRTRGGTSRINSLGQAMGGAVNLTPHGIARTAERVADAITGKTLVPEKQATVTAAKNPASVMRNYSDAYRNLEAQAALTLPPAIPQSPMLALPAPPIYASGNVAAWQGPKTSNIEKLASKFNR